MAPEGKISTIHITDATGETHKGFVATYDATNGWLQLDTFESPSDPKASSIVALPAHAIVRVELRYESSAAAPRRVGFLLDNEPST